MANLNTLPSELLYDIHVLSHSPHLPYTSQTLYHTLGISPPSSHVAQYLLSLYAPPHSSTRELLARCLRHPICTLEVVWIIERYWAAKVEKGAAAADVWAGKKAKGSVGKLELEELPKQLFRDLERKSTEAFIRKVGSEEGRSSHGSLMTKLVDVSTRRGPQIRKKRKRAASPFLDALAAKATPLVPSLLPLLTHLFTHYSPSPSSHKGYPLCASITAYPTSLPLTRFLLDRGADPGCNDGYAVRLAIGKRDLKLVKMLVEREDDGGSGGGKKRKLGDRCKVDSQMLRLAVKYQARDISDYLMGKGVVPDMKTLLALENMDD